MKRVAIIVVFLFLFLSIIVTVYILVSSNPEASIKNNKPGKLALAPTEVIVPTAIPTVIEEVKSSSSQPNQLPLCTGLSASPTSGKVPLTVLFIGSGTDLDGTLTKFEFSYGDGKSQTIEKKVGDTASLEISHTYLEGGQYTASLRILDNQSSWSAPTTLCKVPITTTGNPKVAGVADNIGQPVLTPTVTPTPTVQLSGTITPTRTPTPTVKVASASATPITAPNVPVAGSFLPTLVVGFGGLFILAMGLLFAL